MKLQMFCVKDTKAEFFNNPFMQHTLGEAERTFKTLVNDPQSTIAKTPEDYQLFHLGSFDNVSGKLELHPAPIHVISGDQLKDR